MGPYNKSERRFCAKERKNIFNIERRERGSEGIHGGIVKKRVH